MKSSRVICLAVPSQPLISCTKFCNVKVQTDVNMLAWTHKGHLLRYLCAFILCGLPHGLTGHVGDQISTNVGAQTCNHPMPYLIEYDHT